MKNRVFAWWSLVLVLSLVLAGCGGRVTAKEIVTRVQETARTTQDAHAIVSVKANVQGMNVSARAEVWEKQPNKIRAEVLESSRPEYQGATLVSDGEQAWFYDPSDNKVLVGNANEIDIPLPQQVLASMQEMIQQVLDASDAELAGEEQVAGHDTYKLVLNPKQGSESRIFPGNGTATLWVDKERWIVLRATYEAGSLGTGTMEVESFELNSGVSDDLFRFEAPEGAEIVDVQSQRPEPLTLDEARAQAGFPLLVPGYVPGDAKLLEVFRAGEAIILRYDHSPDVAFTVLQGQTIPDLPRFGNAQQMTVRGQSATSVTDEAGGNTFLYWTENGVTVAVAGHLSLDEAVRVAESLE